MAKHGPGKETSQPLSPFLFPAPKLPQPVSSQWMSSGVLTLETPSGLFLNKVHVVKSLIPWSALPSLWPDRGKAIKRWQERGASPQLWNIDKHGLGIPNWELPDTVSWYLKARAPPHPVTQSLDQECLYLHGRGSKWRWLCTQRLALTTRAAHQPLWTSLLNRARITHQETAYKKLTRSMKILLPHRSTCPSLAYTCYGWYCVHPCSSDSEGKCILAHQLLSWLKLPYYKLPIP